MVAGLIGAAGLEWFNRRVPAPDVAYISIHGEQTSQAALRGKVVLVNFWATTCAVCVAKMPQWAHTHRQYHTQGLETIAVTMAYDPPGAVAAFVRRQPLPFFVALDIQGHLAQAFGDITATPTTLLIDRQGRIVQRIVGAPDFPALHRRIQHLLAEAG